MLEISGNYIEHPVYGMQLKVESYQVAEPDDELSMERYLGSGAIKGIGYVFGQIDMPICGRLQQYIQDTASNPVIGIRMDACFTGTFICNLKTGNRGSDGRKKRHEERYGVSSEIWDIQCAGCQDI